MCDQKLWLLLLFRFMKYKFMIHIFKYRCHWGKPEQAPHKHEVCAACLSVFLSVCPYVHNTKIYKSSVIYGVPLVVDSSVYGAFAEVQVNCFVCQRSTKKHVATNTKKASLSIANKNFN